MTRMTDSALEDDEEDCRIPPDLDFRWCHSGSSHLSLLSTPLTQTKAVAYAAFSVLENENLEAAFNALKPAEREAALRKMGEWKEDKKDDQASSADPEDKGTKGDKEKNKEGNVLVGDMSDIDRNGGRKPSLTPSLDAERYPDPDSQPIEPIPDDTPEEEDHDKVKGVPVSQVGSCLSFLWSWRHVLISPSYRWKGRTVRGGLAHHVPVPGILGSYGFSGTGHQGDLVLGGRD